MNSLPPRRDARAPSTAAPPRRDASARAAGSVCHVRVDQAESGRTAFHLLNLRRILGLRDAAGLVPVVGVPRGGAARIVNRTERDAAFSSHDMDNASAIRALLPGFEVSW